MNRCVYYIDYITEAKVSINCDIIPNRAQAIKKVDYLNEVNNRLGDKGRFACSRYELIELEITGKNKLSEYAEEYSKYQDAYYKLRGK